MNQAHAAPDEPVRLTVLQDSEIKTIVLTPQDHLLTLKNLPASDFLTKNAPDRLFMRATSY